MFELPGDRLPNRAAAEFVVPLPLDVLDPDVPVLPEPDPLPLQPPAIPPVDDDPVDVVPVVVVPVVVVPALVNTIGVVIVAAELVSKASC